MATRLWYTCLLVQCGDGVCGVFAHNLVCESLMSGCTLVSGIRGGCEGGVDGGWGPRCAPTSLTTGAAGGEGGGGGKRRKRRWKWGLVWVPSAAADSPCPGLLGQATLAMHIYTTRELEVCVEATLS